MHACSAFILFFVVFFFPIVFFIFKYNMCVNEILKDLT